MIIGDEAVLLDYLANIFQIGVGISSLGTTGILGLLDCADERFGKEPFWQKESGTTSHGIPGQSDT
jgi:hypothetical protein